MKHRLRVGIMGAGRIAHEFDAPGDERILTLAHAVMRSNKLELGGFFDLNPDRAKAAEQKWRCPSSPRDRQAWLDSGWDIVCIATPDEAHPADLADVIVLRPKAILVEKPLATDSARALRLLRRAHKFGVPVLVDFPRRWHTGVVEVAKRLAAGRLGNIQRITATYSGGLEHSGVHLLDLVSHWCPGILSVQMVRRTAHETAFNLKTAHGLIELRLCSAVQKGYIWEATFDTPMARISIGGIPERLTVQTLQPHPFFAGFQCLAETNAWFMDDQPLLLRAVDQLAGMAGHAARTAAWHELEFERHHFFHQVFKRAQS